MEYKILENKKEIKGAKIDDFKLDVLDDKLSIKEIEINCKEEFIRGIEKQEYKRMPIKQFELKDENNNKEFLLIDVTYFENFYNVPYFWVFQNNKINSTKRPANKTVEIRFKKDEIKKPIMFNIQDDFNSIRKEECKNSCINANLKIRGNYVFFPFNNIYDFVKDIVIYSIINMFYKQKRY